MSTADAAAPEAVATADAEYARIADKRQAANAKYNDELAQLHHDMRERAAAGFGTGTLFGPRSDISDPEFCALSRRSVDAEIALMQYVCTKGLKAAKHKALTDDERATMYEYRAAHHDKVQRHIDDASKALMQARIASSFACTTQQSRAIRDATLALETLAHYKAMRASMAATTLVPGSTSEDRAAHRHLVDAARIGVYPSNVRVGFVQPDLTIGTRNSNHTNDGCRTADKITAVAYVVSDDRQRVYYGLSTFRRGVVYSGTYPNNKERFDSSKIASTAVARLGQTRRWFKINDDCTGTPPLPLANALIAMAYSMRGVHEFDDADASADADADVNDE